MEVVDKELRVDPFNVGHQKTAKYLADSTPELQLKEELNLQQKSRIQWLKAGDSNTSYFHNTIKRRQYMNAIRSMKTISGEYIFQRNHIVSEAVSHFKCLWAYNSSFLVISSNPRRILSDQAKQWLDRFISDDEIKQAIFEAYPDKETGWDGFTTMFFQSCWPVIKMN